MSQQDLKDSLLALEQDLLAPEVRSSEVRLNELLADEFVEFGSSGRIFDKQTIIHELTQSEPIAKARVEDFRIVTSNEVLALVTYLCAVTSDTGDTIRTSNRSSLWMRIDERWQMVFHQGTRTK